MRLVTADGRIEDETEIVPGPCTAREAVELLIDGDPRFGRGRRVRYEVRLVHGDRGVIVIASGDHVAR